MDRKQLELASIGKIYRNPIEASAFLRDTGAYITADDYQDAEAEKMFELIMRAINGEQAIDVYLDRAGEEDSKVKALLLKACHEADDPKIDKSSVSVVMKQIEKTPLETVELSLLGKMLILDTKSFLTEKKQVCESLEPKYFSDKSHQRLFEAIKELISEESGFDRSALILRLQSKGEKDPETILSKAYRAPYRDRLTDDNLGTFRPEEACRTIRQAAIERGVKVKPYNFDRDKPLEAISMDELMKKELPDLRVFVDGLIHAGMGVIAAKQKFGKSFFVLQLCLAVTTGQPFLGRKVNERCGALYLDLESNERRPRDRVKKLTGKDEAPGSLYIITGRQEIPKIGQGFEKKIGEFLDHHPDIGLVVVDVLQKIQPPRAKNSNAYEGDYEYLAPLRVWADSRGICLLLVTHLRKDGGAASGDTFDNVTGSAAITGAADFSIVLSRSRNSGNAILSFTSRELPEFTEEIEHDSSMRWSRKDFAE